MTKVLQIPSKTDVFYKSMSERWLVAGVAYYYYYCCCCYYYSSSYCYSPTSTSTAATAAAAATPTPAPTTTATSGYCPPPITAGLADTFQTAARQAPCCQLRQSLSAANGVEIRILRNNRNKDLH